MTNFIVEFDKAFKAAIVSEENINEDGSINWNFVDSDVFMAMKETFGEFDVDLFYKEFEACADEEEEYRQAMA